MQFTTPRPLQQEHAAAERADRTEIASSAEVLLEHARTEAAAIYPAAALVGQVLRQRLGQCTSVAT